MAKLLNMITQVKAMKDSTSYMLAEVLKVHLFGSAYDIIFA